MNGTPITTVEDLKAIKRHEDDAPSYIVFHDNTKLPVAVVMPANDWRRSFLTVEKNDGSGEKQALKGLEIEKAASGDSSVNGGNPYVHSTAPPAAPAKGAETGQGGRRRRRKSKKRRKSRKPRKSKKRRKSRKPRKSRRKSRRRRRR